MSAGRYACTGPLRVALGTALLAGVLVGCSPQGSPADNRTDTSGEHLLGQAPAGWKPVSANTTSTMRIAEFAPASPADEPAEKMTFESVKGDPLPDPIEFVRGLGDEQSKHCERYDHFNIYSGLENNYPTSVRLLTCAQHALTGKGEVTLIKAIQGNDSFYIISRTRRVPPFEDDNPLAEEEIGAWALHLRTLSLCDPSRPGHPCPEAGTTPGDDSPQIGEEH